MSKFCVIPWKFGSEQKRNGMKFHIFGFPKQKKCLKYAFTRNVSLSNIIHELPATLLKLISPETLYYILLVNPFPHTWLATDVLKNVSRISYTKKNVKRFSHVGTKTTPFINLYHETKLMKGKG